MRAIASHHLNPVLTIAQSLPNLYPISDPNCICRYNATLTGPPAGVRAFTASLAELDWDTFGEGRTDFKYVDGLPFSQRLKGIKCWPVQEIVTYGFPTSSAPLDMRGTHLPPREFHKALEDPNAVVIDVRNFNESLIGKFVPPGQEVKSVGTSDGSMKVLDPCMRRSTEFPKWVDDNKHQLEGKKVSECSVFHTPCFSAHVVRMYSACHASLALLTHHHTPTPHRWTTCTHRC